MSFITREQVESEYFHTQRLKSPTDIGFTWAEAKGRVGVFNYEELKIQVEDWINDPELKCYDYNNRKVETPDGKEWWVCVLQVCLPDGELDAPKNPRGCMSLMLFGVMVAGYTYAFENETLRDWVFEAVSERKPMPPYLYGKAGKEMYQRIQDLKSKPTCCLCGNLCDCPYGHNPYPLAEDGKCCNSCNASKVIPARMKGLINTQLLKNNPEEKEYLKKGCMNFVKKQLNTIEAKTKEAHPEWGKFLPCLNSDFNFSPAMTEVKKRFFANQKKINIIRTCVLEIADRFIEARINRSIRCHSTTSVEDICFMTEVIIGNEFHKNDIKDLFLKWVLLQREFYDAEEEERKRITDRLVEADTPSETSSTSRSSADEEKERTRKANKAKQSKAQQKAEFEKEQIRCAKIRAEQERQEKEKKRIAKAKKEKARRQAEKV